MKKALFIEQSSFLINTNNQIPQFFPGAIQFLSRIDAELEYELILLADSDFPEFTFPLLANEGVEFKEVFTGTPVTQEVLSLGLKRVWDRDNSYRITYDSQSILLETMSEKITRYDFEKWKDVFVFLSSLPRTTSVIRTTSETDIQIELNLDGHGHTYISTGIGFFDHMLAQLGIHGGMNLKILVRGDLHVDEHHTIEDVGSALGSAFLNALGSKKGIARYGFLLPMDDCLAQVAVDFGGRPYLVWDVKFSREKIGDVPTEMIAHFFRSFCDSARCNLNIKAEGENEHHKTEAIFKGFARALQNAIVRGKNETIPSTKGIL